jgi:hypothetical protein
MLISNLLKNLKKYIRKKLSMKKKEFWPFITVGKRFWPANFVNFFAMFSMDSKSASNSGFFCYPKIFVLIFAHFANFEAKRARETAPKNEERIFTMCLRIT